ncbi:MAG: hypothetical protein V4850_31955 [Myxococcota bacterium]
MRALLLGLVVLLPLAGCPQPADPGAPVGPAPDGALPPGAPGPDGGVPGGAPGPAVEGGPPAGAVTGVPDNFAAPGLASFITDGKSVTLSGTVVGAKEVQIDVTAVREVDGQPTPEVLEIVRTTDGTFSIKAPATFDRTLYVSAIAVTDKQPSPSDPGGVAAPVKLEGKDVKVEIVVGKDPAYARSLPWWREPGDDMAPPSGGTPGGTPGGPPIAAPADGAAPPVAAPASTAPPGAPPVASPPVAPQ